MIWGFSSGAAHKLQQQVLVCFFLLPLCFWERSAAVGARTNTIQQVQCVNFEKNINMWFVFQNPENIMKAIKYPYCRQPERALPLWVHAFRFSYVSFSSQLHSRRARPGSYVALSQVMRTSCRKYRSSSSCAPNGARSRPSGKEGNDDLPPPTGFVLCTYSRPADKEPPNRLTHKLSDGLAESMGAF